ncbi:uncharacterized protein LOC110055872 [Orbicella faveolata]|uniref:uncharacterized protein LOC110055872 n=1 Tax=Orbicella faveolata TaxID=48498 RepID=UPI0009E275FC|nr:uncharacterized protein LOC110055872 [Orbicella faveolata]
MVAADEKPRALVLGHSFVRRLKEFAAHNHSDRPYDLNLGLSNVCSIIFHGIGGRTVDKMIRNNLDKIRSVAHNIVVLELGLNDLCDKDSDPETIKLSMVELAELLLKEFSLRFIAVCEVTVRQNEPFVGYNERAALQNGHLRESLHVIPAAKCWQHRGLINPTNNAVYAPDGIHLNYIENNALYRSYRGAILWALSQVKQC